MVEEKISDTFFNTLYEHLLFILDRGFLVYRVNLLYELFVTLSIPLWSTTLCVGSVESPKQRKEIVVYKDWMSLRDKMG